MVLGSHFHLAKELLIAGGLYKCPPPMLSTESRQTHCAMHKRLTAILKAKPVKQFFGELQATG